MDRVYPEGIETISEGLEYWHPDESATHGNIIATFFFFFFFAHKFRIFSALSKCLGKKSTLVLIKLYPN